MDALAALQIVGVLWFFVGVFFPRVNEPGPPTHDVDQFLDAALPVVDKATRRPRWCAVGPYLAR